MDGSVVTPPHVARPLRLLPFHALSLAPSRIGSASSVRAFTRPYREVADRLRRWEARGQVVRDPGPAIYLHEYTADGITVRGVVGALDLSRRASTRTETAVFPHEGIHPAQAEELAERMLEMQINPAPILLVHRGTASVRRQLAAVQRREPYLELTDRGRQRHRIWAVRDRAELARLDAALAAAQPLIADGHHRYAAYLRMQESRLGPATDAGLAMLVDQDDTPLFLGAIHRVLGGVTLAALQEAAATVGWGYVGLPADRAVAALNTETLVLTDGHAWAALRLPATPVRAAVELLHEDLVPALPRIPSAIAYHHSVDHALAALTRRRGVAVLMPAPEFDQVLRAAAAGTLLPEKATSFQPKPSVGVLIRSLRDG